MKKPADPNAEYVLTHDHLAKSDLGGGFADKGPDYDPERVLAPRGTVVTVKYKQHGGWFHKSMTGGSTTLEFTIKATGEKFLVNYGWMFALNTPENRALLARYQEAQLTADRADAFAKKCLEQVETVAGPFEGVFAPA